MQLGLYCIYMNKLPCLKIFIKHQLFQKILITIYLYIPNMKQTIFFFRNNLVCMMNLLYNKKNILSQQKRAILNDLSSVEHIYNFQLEHFK